jgi:hypothetical protein
MLFKFPAAFALFGLLTSSAIAVPAVNDRRNNGGHPTMTASACTATGTGTASPDNLDDILDTLLDVFKALTIGPADSDGPRPFVVVPPVRE